MATSSRKEDTIAICMKWCEAFLLVAILSFVTGFFLQAQQAQSHLNPIFGLVFLLAVFGCWISTVTLGFLVYKSWLKFSFPFLFMFPPLYIGMSIMAYVDGAKLISKSGYSIGIWGPREMTLFGKKNH